MNFFNNDISLYLHTLMILKIDVTLIETARAIHFYSGVKLYAAGTRAVSLKAGVKPMLFNVRIDKDDTFSAIILNNLGLFGEYRARLI